MTTIEENSTRVAVHGASGRMGLLVLAEVLNTSGLSLHAATTHGGSGALGRDAGELVGLRPCGVPLGADLTVLRGADVVIDFSHPSGFGDLLQHLEDCALVSGTTGLDDAGRQGLRELSARAPVLWASNFSMGVAVLTDLVRRASGLLADWDAELVETHHRRKVDAPSGTAKTLVDAIDEGRSRTADRVHGREGLGGARRRGEVGVHALRLGDVIGEHELSLGGDGEVLRLSHSATERRVFAVGATRAALWIARRPAGTYSFAQVIGLEGSDEA